LIYDRQEGALICDESQLRRTNRISSQHRHTFYQDRINECRETGKHRTPPDMVTQEAKKEPVISTEVKPEAIDRNRNPETKKTEPTKGGGTCNSGHGRSDNNSSLWCWMCFSFDPDCDGCEDCEDCCSACVAVLLGHMMTAKAASREVESDFSNSGN
jgi:hypothetical protein